MRAIISRTILVIIIFSSFNSCRSSKADITPPVRPDQIELNLADKMKPQRISAGFKSYGMDYLCTLNMNDNICVYRFDTTAIKLVDLISFMKYEVGVQSASTTRGCPKD